jgi:hypothetical protein
MFFCFFHSFFLFGYGPFDSLLWGQRSYVVKKSKFLIGCWSPWSTYPKRQNEWKKQKNRCLHAQYKGTDTEKFTKSATRVAWSPFSVCRISFCFAIWPWFYINIFCSILLLIPGIFRCNLLIVVHWLACVFIPCPHWHFNMTVSELSKRALLMVTMLHSYW